ncbi:MAG: AAC(3) family N-acetyltransferase [Armatimonadetes bacterium]|nr:AAC(3) family N-acetyltransferase [Armatimonadota bacterium]
MKPEPADKRVKVYLRDVVRAAREVGVQPGDTVMFHSSLSSMGWVVGGPNTVIDAFLEAVGPEGTVAVPTLWWHPTDPPLNLADWDVHTSPSYVGLITETFRKRPDSVRSDNPTHSVSAIGRRAHELTRDHGRAGLRPCVFGDTAFARESPWQRLYDWDAAYCFIGVDFSVNTMGHFAETLFVERVLEACPPDRRPALEARLRRWEKPGVWPSHDFRAMGERLAALGLVRFSRIGSATLRCIRARAMVDNILAALEAEPDAWFDPEFLAWLKDAQGLAGK